MPTDRKPMSVDVPLPVPVPIDASFPVESARIAEAMADAASIADPVAQNPKHLMGCRVSKIRRRDGVMSVNLTRDLCEMLGFRVGDRVLVAAYADGTVIVRKAGQGF